MLGAGTQLMRMEVDRHGSPRLALARDEARLFALLAVAFRRPTSPDILHHLEDASNHWQRGDKALANIRMAFARLPRLAGETDAWCLHLAAGMLDDGYSPGRLLRELGYPPSPAGFRKYDPNQPRVPAGSGRASGEWTSGGGEGGSTGGVTITPVSIPVSVNAPQPGTATAGVTASAGTTVFQPGTLAEGLFGAEEARAFLEGLALLGTTVGAGVVLGATFFPSPTGDTSEGPVPDDPGLSYSVNIDEGILRFLHQGASGEEVVAAARLGRDGIFFETETGTPVARIVGGSIVLDAQSLASESEDERSQAGAETNASSDIDTPQLCPDPGPDAPHGASERAIAYQAHISWLKNPQRPLPPGMAVSLIDPQNGRRVVYDDCRESDGTMIEAKGPGYAKLLRYQYFNEEIFPARWSKQAERQVDAGGGRDLDWFFAEEFAADWAREIFEDNEKLWKIWVILKSME